MSGTATKVGVTAGAGIAIGGLMLRREDVEWAIALVQKLTSGEQNTLLSIFLGMFLGWMVTARVNSATGRKYTMLAESAGAVSAFAAIALMWQERIGILVAAVVGLSTPYTWALLLIVLELLPSQATTRWATVLRGTEDKRL